MGKKKKKKKKGGGGGGEGEREKKKNGEWKNENGLSFNKRVVSLLIQALNQVGKLLNNKTKTKQNKTS